MQGQGCQECSIEELSKRYTKSTEQWVEDAKKVWGDTYDYSLANYTGADKTVKIICSKHGEFEQLAGSHLAKHGCWKCASIKIGKASAKTTKQFVEDAIAIHGDSYDYSLVDYKTAKIKVEIICKKHNESFWQTPDGHLGKKAGCPKCALENGGWNSKAWVRMADASKRKDSYKLYALEIWGNGEHFYEIGVTFRTIAERFGRKNGRGLPKEYEYKILKTYTDEIAKNISDMEDYLKHAMRGDHYRPLISFGGHATECFSAINLDTLDDIAKNHINTLQSQ